MQQQYQCPNCRAAIDFGAKFCSNCGTQLDWPSPQTQSSMQFYCPRCNTPVSTVDNVCQNCGARLSWPDQQQTHINSSVRGGSARRTESNSSLKYLKWAGISLLSLLLFLSLSAFGPAFLFKQTVLNPEFVKSEVNKLELAELVDDLIAQPSFEDVPEIITVAISNTVNKLEPRLEEELDTFITSIYDYLLGKRQSPNLAELLRDTFLHTDFLASIIDELDIESLIKPIIYDQVGNWIPEEMSSLTPYIYPAVDELLIKEGPWIKEQIKANIDQIADFVMSLRNDFNVTISTEPVVNSVRESLLEDIEELPLLQITGLPPALVEGIFNEFFNDFSQYIPDTISIDETLIGDDLPDQMGEIINEAEDGLQLVRNYISDFQLYYTLIIVFMVLFVIGIILIFREVKGATRTLGSVFLAFGVIEILSLILMKNTINEQLGQLPSDIPAQLQQWLTQLISNISSPLQILSIGFIIGGIVLIVVSIMYRPRYSLD